MKIEEQVLSIEQMKHLQELSIDTSDASVCWVKRNGFFDDPIQREIIINGIYLKSLIGVGNVIPTYTIGDLIEKLPKNIDGSCLLIEFCDSNLGYGDWYCGELCGINARQKFNDKSLKEALYDLLCWVAENHKELLNKK